MSMASRTSDETAAADASYSVQGFAWTSKLVSLEQILVSSEQRNNKFWSPSKTKVAKRLKVADSV